MRVLNGEKPERFAVNSYSAAGTRANANEPLASVVRVWVDAPRLMRMVTPGSRVPAESFTVPETVPIEVWAVDTSVNPSRHTPTASVTTRISGLLAAWRGRPRQFMQL